MTRPLSLLAAGCLALLLTACGPDTPRSAAPLPPPAPAAAVLPKPDSLAKFIWDSEACVNTGFYRPGQYTEPQLRNTLTLFSGQDLAVNSEMFFAFQRDVTKCNPDNIDRLTRELDAEYAAEADTLRRLPIVPAAFWQKMRQLRLKELQELYALYRLNLVAYKDPALLRQTPHLSAFPVLCKEYTTALASPDTLVLQQAWKKLVEEQKTHNGAPESLTQRYEEQYNSPNRNLYARIELMNFGWYNCANAQRKYGDATDNYALDKEFARLFRTVKAECDETQYD